MDGLSPLVITLPYNFAETIMAPQIAETELYPPVKEFFENLGYRINAEVSDCDITAVKDDELIVVELKTSFSLKLLYQIVERQKIADSVYAAIPAFSGKYPKEIGAMRALVKRLCAGLIVVHFLKSRTWIEILVDPTEYMPRKSRKGRYAVLSEAAGRVAEMNTGGASSKTRRMTLYRQHCIQIAAILAKNGPLSAKDLRDAGCVEKVGYILNNNFYGWFVRVEKGIYSVTDACKKELKGYKELVKTLVKPARKIKTS